MSKKDRKFFGSRVIEISSQDKPTEIQVLMGDNAHWMPLELFQNDFDETYEGNISILRSQAGQVVGLKLDIIAPMPDDDPNEPIPYEVTSEGREIAKMWEKNGKDWPGTMEELTW